MADSLLLCRVNSHRSYYYFLNTEIYKAPIRVLGIIQLSA